MDEWKKKINQMSTNQVIKNIPFQMNFVSSNLTFLCCSKEYQTQSILISGAFNKDEHINVNLTEISFQGPLHKLLIGWPTAPKES